MNKKKILGVVIISLIFSIFIFKKYKASENSYKTLYVIQVGAYKDYENVIKNTRNFDNYIVYEENNLYKIFIGLTFDKNIYDKLINIYVKDNSSFQKEIKVTNDEFIKNINTYDTLIKNTNDKERLNLIIKEEMKLLNKLLKK